MLRHFSEPPPPDISWEEEPERESEWTQSAATDDSPHQMDTICLDDVTVGEPAFGYEALQGLREGFWQVIRARILAPLSKLFGRSSARSGYVPDTDWRTKRLNLRKVMTKY